jgi:tetratricopeptide (TPR) repeat protein
MRTFLGGVVTIVVLLAGACAPRVVPTPVVTTPRFPEFFAPAVPAELAETAAARHLDRAWSFLQSGELRIAELELRLAMTADPAFHPAEAAAGYLGLARREPGGALTHFDRALEQQGRYVPALVGRGQALVALGREPEAVAAFEAALSADPSLADVRRRVEVLKFQGLERDLVSARDAAKSGRRDEAVRLYRAAIARSPESPFLYRELAVVERQIGDVESALAHYRQAVSLDPGDDVSLAQLGELLEARGALEEALGAYEEALAIRPSDAVAARRDQVRARIELAALPAEYRAIETSPQVTRADLAALIGVRLPLVLEAAQPREAVVITDVRGSWAEPWIMQVARAGVIEPFANHAFQPGGVIDRVDLAEAVSRLLGRLGTAAEIAVWQNARVPFSDLAESHLAYPAASLAVAAGVLARGPGDSFDPSRPVTGAEASAAIERLRSMALAAEGSAALRR